MDSTPDYPACPFDMDPEEWTWFIDQLHYSLRAIERKLDALGSLDTLCEALDLLLVEHRVKSPKRTRFVVTA